MPFTLLICRDYLPELERQTRGSGGSNIFGSIVINLAICVLEAIQKSRERGFVGPKDIDRVREVRQTEERFLASDVFEERSRALPPRNGTGTVREEARETPVYHQCDVAVIGGGPAGCAAAWAAAKAGADVTLLERFNHLG